MNGMLTLASLSVALCPVERTTVEEAADRIEQAYVLEAEARRIASELRALASLVPRAEQCAPDEEFAQALTGTLRKISGDGHFYIEVQADAPEDDWISDWKASGFQKGQGVSHVEILDGNIGYIRIRSFFELEPAFAHFRGAFDMVASTDALILDLRENRGGSSQTAWPLQWTFMSPGTPSPLAMETRLDGIETREEPPVLWRRYGTERPLAILIDENTFSAPEAVAFTLQLVGRATVLGQASGGGAHMLDEGDDLSTGFTLYTPTTRPISVKTGSNWEGVGVRPDVTAGSSEILSKAVETLTHQIANGSPSG